MYFSVHTHSFYSLNDGILDPEKCAIWLKEKNINKISITDHGNTVGVFFCKSAFEKYNIKYYPGSEFYFTDDRNVKNKETRKSCHLTAIAKSYVGVLNLFKLQSESFLSGFYYKPRLDFELLEKYHEGIIFSSACLKGSVSKKLLANDFEGALVVAKHFKDILGQNYFLEIMPHALEEQIIVNKGIIEIAKKMDIKLLATNDSHYLLPEDAEYRDIHIMAGHKTTISQQDKTEIQCRTLYMMDEQEIKRCFKIYHPYIKEKVLMEAIENTVLVLDGEPPEMSDGKLNFPTYTLDIKTAEREGMDEKQCELVNALGQQSRFLWETALKELKRKGLGDNKIYFERLKYEFEMIEKMGFINYFLIVRDIVKHCEEVGIKVGPGRGTAGSSLVSYCLGITKVDPLKYGLIFSRFISESRSSLPDIDLDFEDTKRDQVIKYIYNKYNIYNTSQIITINKLAIKSAIRDIARVLEFNTQDALAISMGAPWEDYKTVEETCQNHPEARELVLNNKNLFRYVNKLVGMPRHFGKHPSGVVISSRKIFDFAPLMFGKDDDAGEKVIMVQFDMDCIKKVGLVKMDILGLKTLSFIQDILKQIKKSTGKEIDIDNIDLEDREVYKMISSGDTSSVFQIEADGITKAVKRIQPDCFHELYDLTSLYRPGGLTTGQLEKYIENKFAKKSDPNFIFHHIPQVNAIIEKTYGAWAFQEQIMKCISDVAGLGMNEADVFRRIIDDLKLEGKEEMVAKYTEKFINGCVKNGILKEDAEKLWAELREYTKYSFNLSHSVLYSVLTFQTAWLKYYYGAYFLLAMFNSAEKNADVTKNSIKNCVKAAKKDGIKILYPNINESEKDFINTKYGIRWSLSHIKGVGENPIEEILLKRPFKSIGDMFEKVNRKKINKKTFVALYGAHALDCLNNIEVVNKFKELYDEESIESLMPESELLREIKYLGLPVQRSYAEEYGDQLDGAFRLSKLNKMRDGEVNVFAGIILESALRKSKKGNIYASLKVEDDNFNNIIVYLKEKDYKKLEHHVEEGKFIKFQAEKIDSTKCRLRGFSLISLKPNSESVAATRILL